MKARRDGNAIVVLDYEEDGQPLMGRFVYEFGVELMGGKESLIRRNGYYVDCESERYSFGVSYLGWEEAVEYAELLLK